MPRSETQNQEIRDERQEQIKRAARKVFARRGLSASRIVDIAAEAGVSHGLMYHYFDSKEEVFHAAVEDAMLGALSQVRAAALERSGSPWERLSWLVGEMISGVEEAPEYVLMLLQVFTNDQAPERTRQLLAKCGEEINRHLLTLIAQGQQVGEVVPEDPAKLVTVLLAAIQGLAASRVQSVAAGWLGVPDPQDFPEPELLLRLLKA